MYTEKKLIITIRQDIGNANDVQIEALKAFWLASFAGNDGITLGFEIREIDPYARIKSMLRLVRSEFEVDDETAVNEPDEAIGSVERTDLVEDEP